MKIEVVNLEYGYPTVVEARKRLMTELDVARGRGVAVLKIIHGYGSSGKGGRLRGALRRALDEVRRTGAIGNVVPGEAWSIFDEASLQLLDRYPDLSRDSDLERGNAGITLVELKRRT